MARAINETPAKVRDAFLDKAIDGLRRNMTGEVTH